MCHTNRLQTVVLHGSTAILATAVLWVSGCAAPTTATPTRQVVAVVTSVVPATRTSQPSATAVPSRTPPARPSATSSPSQTASTTPSQTPTPFPTKAVLIQFGEFFGDGGSSEDPYFGRDTPTLVVYADGQVIIRTRDWSYGYTVLWHEARLTTDEVCQLFSRIDRAGFFDVEGGNNSFMREEDPIYNLPDGLQIGDGAGVYIIQVNGTPSKQVDIYSELAPFVVDEVRTVMELLQEYQPAGLQPYQPEHILLWVESGDTAWWLPPTPRATPWPWPTDYPSLGEAVRDSGVGALLLNGSTATPLLDIQNGAGVVNENGSLYSIIVRPLLPHESPDSISPPPYRPSSYDLPFECN
jgi:hypothetical protein